MGIPLLHPWANRVASRQFSVAGREIDLWAHPGMYTLGPKGLPIHGLLAAAGGWSGRRSIEETADGPRLAAVFDFAAQEDLMTLFPFPHQVQNRGADLGLDADHRDDGPRHRRRPGADRLRVPPVPPPARR